SKDLIDTIISMPGSILANTSIPFNIMVLKKQKSEKGEIKLFDASDFVEKKNRTQNRILVDELYTELQTGVANKYKRIINNDDVVENDYNLTVSRYFVKNITDKINGIKIGKIINPV